MTDTTLVQIEVTEEKGFLHGTDKFEFGDVRRVPEKLAKYFIGLGWAKDTAGKIPAGKRDPNGTALLDVEGSTHSHAAEEIGNG